jgi:hypothetical protein
VIFHQTAHAMPRRNPASAHLEAKAAVDAYESRRHSGKFMPVERQTFERLRADKRFGEVWQQIEPYLQKNDDPGRLIGAIIYAARMALEGPRVLKTSQLNIERWKQAKRHAEALHRHLTQKVNVDHPQSQHLVVSLASLLETIDQFKWAERDADAATVAAPYGLSREFHSARFIPATFMKFMSKGIIDICGKPLDKTVAMLAEIVLKTRATEGQARSARRPTTRAGRGRQRPS